MANDFDCFGEARVAGALLLRLFLAALPEIDERLGREGHSMRVEEHIMPGCLSRRGEWNRFFLRNDFTLKMEES